MKVVNVRSFLLIFLIVLLAFLPGGCAKEETLLEETKASEELGERVEEGFSHVELEEGKVTVKVIGDSVSGLGGGILTIENPRMERFFPGEDRVEVEARTGTWDKGSGQVHMEKEVTGAVRLEKVTIIEHADVMHYNPEAHLLDLEGKVRVSQEHSFLNAEKIIIYLNEEESKVIKIVAKGEVRGTIFPEELKGN